MTTTTVADLADLLARCALGDRAAFERLYRQSAAQLFGLVLRIVREREIASEVLQETYIKIWQRADLYRPTLAQPLTWMGAIARNQAIDRLRRGAHEPTEPSELDAALELADDAAGPAELVDRLQHHQALHDCLARLEGPQRRVLLLAFFEGMTHEQLADRLATPLGTVKSWVRRGLLRLKTCLTEP